MMLNINRCAARRGFYWWAESFRMLKKAPFKWSFVLILYSSVFIAFFLFNAKFHVFPFPWNTPWDPFESIITPWQPIITVPFFMAGIAAIGRAQAGGEKKFKFSSLFAGIGKHSLTLWCIGVLMMVLSIAANHFFKISFGIPEQYGRFLPVFDIYLIFYLVSMVFLGWMLLWQAPMLALFQRAGIGKSILFSLAAMWRNWQAVMVYVLCLFILLVIFQPLFSISVAFAYATIWALLIPAILLPILTIWIMLSAFVAYKDIYEWLIHRSVKLDS